MDKIGNGYVLALEKFLKGQIKVRITYWIKSRRRITDVKNESEH